MKISSLRSLSRRGMLLFALAFLLAVNGGTPFASAKALSKGDPYQVIALVNQVRASYGLPPLQANSALMAAAQGHSDYQASIATVTHSGKGGSSPLQRAMAAGYGGGAKVYISENIYGGNNASPSQAVNWWTGDGIHLQTMINPNATDAGAGVAQNGNTVYYTLLVGYVAGSPAKGSNSPPASGSTLAPTAIPFFPIVTSTPNADGSVVHVVQPGQALWNIAAIYEIPLADLLAMNGLTENSFIHPGDKILIRKAQITPTLVETLFPLPTPTETATPVVRSPTATWNSLEYQDKTPSLPTQPLGYATATNTARASQPPTSSGKLTSNIFPILIIALFLAGGVLILLGTFARPRG
ncbi:MAG: hypothetical protein Kow0088_16180 [Anaerolineales bacterium]